MFQLLTRTLTYICLIFSLTIGVIYYRFTTENTRAVYLDWSFALQQKKSPTNQTPNNTIQNFSLAQEFNNLKFKSKSTAIITKKIQPTFETDTVSVTISAPQTISSVNHLEWKQLKGENEIKTDDGIKLEKLQVNFGSSINLSALAVHLNEILDTKLETNQEPSLEVVELNKLIEPEKSTIDEPASENSKVIAEKIESEEEILNQKEIEPEFFTIQDEEEKEREVQDVVKVKNSSIDKKETPVTVNVTDPGSSESKASQVGYSSTEYSSGAPATIASNTSNSTTVIRPISVSSNKAGSLVSFQIQDKYNSGLNKLDNGSGEIEINEVIQGTRNLKTISIETSDHFITNVDVPLAAGVTEKEIPVFEKSIADALGIQTGVEGRGFLLVEVNDQIQDVLIDDESSVKICLNKQFQQSNDDCSYLFFSNVTVGNRYLRFSDQKDTSKFVHINEDEITFEFDLNLRSEPLQLSFYSRSVLSEEATPVTMASSDVQLFFSGNDGRKLSNNIFEWSDIERNFSERIYLKLTHLKEPLYVGVAESAKVEIPDESYMRKVINEFKIQGQSKVCLAQINLSQKIKQVDIGLESHLGSQIFKILYLDKDGTFYDSPSEKTQKIFLMGENTSNEDLGEEGKFLVKITNLDNSVNYFSTFCSPDTYLVEQL